MAVTLDTDHAHDWPDAVRNNRAAALAWINTTFAQMQGPAARGRPAEMRHTIPLRSGARLELAVRFVPPEGGEDND